MENEYIFGDSNRLFLNTALGCSSACSYCYLPTLGYPISTNNIELKISAEHLFNLLKNDKRLIRGKSGTILSIGCFSECWDSSNRSETINLLNMIFSLGNRVQLATKRELKNTDLLKLKTESINLLYIFISSATIQEWKNYEYATTNPMNRFKSFTVCKNLGIKAYLYIKPVIKNVTKKDLEAYKKIMTIYDVPVVVGDLFTMQGTDKPSPISEKLYISSCMDNIYIYEELIKYGDVYSNSTDVMKENT